MTGWTRAAALLAAIGIAGCARATPQAPSPPPQDLVVLAPDPESGEVGQLTVSSPAGQVTLAAANQSTTIVSGAAPSPPVVLDQAAVTRLFGDALSVLPPAPRRFNLYFETGSDTLTAESRVLVDEVIAAVRGWVAPEVSVIGHTDTTGTAETNLALGLKRAVLIRDRLVDAGLDAGLVDLVSHGESDLLVPTPDNTDEARNRRVEVTVR